MNPIDAFKITFLQLKLSFVHEKQLKLKLKKQRACVYVHAENVLIEILRHSDS